MTEDKKNSRKFLVWVVWGFVTLVVIAYAVAIAIITKQIADSAVNLVEKSLGYFFGVSMLYLGVNAGQKVGLAFADKFSVAEDAEEEK